MHRAWPKRPHIISIDMPKAFLNVGLTPRVSTQYCSIGRCPIIAQFHPIIRMSRSGCESYPPCRPLPRPQKAS